MDALSNSLIFRLLVSSIGLLTIYLTLSSAIRTFVLPRGESVHLTGMVFNFMRMVFNFFTRKADTYEIRDRMMAMYAPVTLLILPVTWVVLLLVGYSCIYWALGVRPFEQAIELSGSALLTLGTTPYINLPITLIEFSEATIGLGIVALLISYLPTMYNAFSRRESQISMLEVRAGTPPNVQEFITRLHRIRGLDYDYLNDIWQKWEIWFTELEESHTSLAALVFFRSPDPHKSWVTASGAILDTAAFITSTVDMPRDPQAQLTIRAGYLALQNIGRLFQIDFNPHPRPDGPVSIARFEFDEVYDALLEEGVPLKPDRDQCWKDFAGWRVNYDLVLLRLAGLTMAPYAPWVSDRSIPGMLERHFKS